MTKAPIMSIYPLEPVCCKKRPKIVPDQFTGLGNKGPLKVLNGTKMILDDHRNNMDSFRIKLESFRSFRGPLLLKPVNGQELFFDVSYSKPALRFCLPIHKCIKWLGNF